MAGPSSADSRVIKQTIGEELEFGHAAQKEVKPEAYPSNKTFAPGYEQDYDTAGGRAGTTAYKKIEGKTADVKEAKGYQSWLPEGFEPEPERPKVSTVDEQPSPITDDMAFDVLTDTTLGDFNSSKDSVIKQARAVGGDRADELEMVFGMESSYGQDPKAKGNILQIKNKGLLKEAENIDLGNPTQVANFYVNKTSELTKDFREYKVQGGDLATSKTGKTFDIFGALESEGIDESGVRYLTWQQGRKGVADIATALETGKIGKKTVENMLNNLSEDQRKSIIAAHGKPPYDDTKLLGFSKKSGTKNFIQAWLKIQSTKMKGYKR